jgi:hypothetical protein
VAKKDISGSDLPFRVHLADGSKLDISAPDPIAARKRAEAMTEHRITKIKRVWE